MLEMVLFIFEMLPATECAQLMSHAAPAFMFAHCQPCQLHVWNKAAHSKQSSEAKSMVWVGIEGLHGWGLMNRQDMSRMLKWCHMAWKGDYSIFYVCSMINSPGELLVMRKTQPWENPDLSVGWLPGVGNHLLLYSQVAPEGNNDKQKRAFPHYVWQ